MVRMLLLIAMAFTVPLFYYMFVVGGFVSYAMLFVMTLENILYPFRAVPVIECIHLLAYGWLLYYVSGVVTRFIWKGALPQRIVLLASLLAALALVGTMRIFGVGHSEQAPVTAYAVLF